MGRSDAGRAEVDESRILARMARAYEHTSKETRLGELSVSRPHPLLLSLAKAETSLLVAPATVWDSGRDLLKPFAPRIAAGATLVVLLGHPREADLGTALNMGIATILPEDPTADELALAAARAFELLDAKARAVAHERSATRYDYELDEIINIARAMTTQRDVGKLLGLILEKSRFITGADAGSVFVVETTDKGAQLRFKLTQNDSVQFDSREFVMPVSNRSIAGSAALHKKTINLSDVYQLPAGTSFGFDRSFDDKIGYRTKSVLTVPLISQRDEVLGVIQLINKKRDPHHVLATKADVDAFVVPFDERSEELLGMLASQAAVSLETATLYDEIQKLFDGFVNASVEAIEQRDPTTSGHSRRVADLTVGLAKVVDREGGGPYKDATFTREDLRELEYASLLHDFGKIGVREKVLVKAKKLYDESLSVIQSRFDFVSRTIEVDVLSRKVSALEKGAASSTLEALDKELADRRAELQTAYDAILSANEPTVLQAGDFARIEAIAKETYYDLRGEMRALLTADEVVALSVKRGSLTSQEFDEIRSHVSHTFKFLTRIPWGKAFRRVPMIAGAHHERLNGTGYPNRWKAEEIPVQSKMMSISDIFDALTAADRPYKKAMPTEKALDILGFEVKDGHVDGELVRIFREAKVWEEPSIRRSTRPPP